MLGPEIRVDCLSFRQSRSSTLIGHPSLCRRLMPLAPALCRRHVFNVMDTPYCRRHECGNEGTRNRTRRVLRDDGCGGTCQGAVAESEACNIRCCPRNCAYSPWNDWLYCKCSESECEKVGNRYVCVRSRKKIQVEECGGYCDNIVVEERCGNPCCYRDCILGPWAPWSDCQAPCEQPGVKYRNRTVTQEPKCGGRRCQQETEQRDCTGSCCPLDCVLGPWSAWSACPTTCGTDTVRRTRFVQEAECGGLECPDSTAEETQQCKQYVNVDCKVSPWSVWSDCNLFNGKCGQGSRTRTRTVLVAPQCQGIECPPLEEESTCKGDCCVADCVVSEWSKFGHCSTSCGRGQSNSTREVIVAQDCGGDPCPELVRFEPCLVQGSKDCEFTSWTPWSRCDNDCGQGTETRTRTLLTPAYCGGQCPSLHDKETRACESYDAKADCKVGEWESWSECVRDCEKGRTSRSRVIQTIDACGGVPCSSFNLTEVSTCHKPCEQLCNQGVCSCREGNILQDDKVTCQRRTCNKPKRPKYCGPGTVPFKSCLPVNLNCPSETKFKSRCNATCQGSWVVKGGEPFITCQANGQWDSTKIFCGPVNKAPLNISVSTQEVSELMEAGQCFAELTTTTDDEPWDKHKYTIVQDGSDNLRIKNDHLCCIKPFDFERTGMSSWQTTIRSTDLDGLYVEREFTFSLLNENDPPRSVSLSPDQVPENSPKGTVVGCLQGADDDPGQTISFFIVKSIGKLFELFQDNENNTCVRVSKESDPRCYTEGGSWCHLNFEQTDGYYIAIMARDDGSPPLSSYFDVHIGVRDVNEPITDIYLLPADVPESVPPGEPLVQFSAEDEDQDQQHTYRLVNDASGLFSTDGHSLLASRTFDFEQDPARSFIITVEVTDDGQPPMTAQKEIAFRIGDKNESPYNLMITGAVSSDLGNLVLRENMPGTLIGTVSVYDPDAGDTITLSVSDPRFSLQNKRCAPLKDNVYNYCSAQLVGTEAVDFELTPSLNLTVTAVDDNFHHVDKEFTLTVIDQNDPPTDIEVNRKKGSEITVQENHPDTRVGDIVVVDEDQGDSHAIFLSGSASSHFRVEQGQLFTTTASSLDYESQTSLSLVMTAIDGGQPAQTVMKTFAIVVVDVNEAPTAISLSKTQVAENSPAGTEVGTLSAVDPDNQVTAHQNFTFSLKDDASGRFRVNGDRLVVTEVAENCFSSRCSLNHEIQPDLLVEARLVLFSVERLLQDLQATDSGSPPLSVVTPVIVSVTDVNDAPTNIRLSKNTVRENKPPGMLVGSIMADDDDILDAVTFTLLNGSDVFSIENGDKLMTKQKLNYEENQSFVLAVRASDNGQPPATTDGVITVVTEDEAEPPVFLVPTVMWAVENEPAGSVVGSVLVRDPDLGDHLDVVLHESTQSFVLGDPACSNSESGVTCNVTLMTSAVLEFETENKYELDLTARDGQGHSVVKVISVLVNDTNDPPTDVLVGGIAVEEVRVAEGSEGEQWRLEVVEEDAGQDHEISIASQDGDHLTLEGSLLKVTSAYDFETESEGFVVLSVEDSGVPPRTLIKSITIVVEDVNETPSGLTLSAYKVSENSRGGTVVGQLLASDPDGDQSLTFFLQDDAGQRFEIDGDKLVVKDNGECGGNAQPPCRLNFEKEVTHKVTVMVTDSGFPPKHATFDLDIEVTDSNDPPHDIQLSGKRSSVGEVTKTDTPVGKLTVVDEDTEQVHTFTLLDDAGGMFKVTPDGTVVKATDERLDVRQVYSIEVKATDSGSPQAEVQKTFYLSVSGVSEAPGIPTLAPRDPTTLLAGASSTLQVPENVAEGRTVAVLTSVDKDPDSSLAFALLEDGGGHFVLGGEAECEAKDGGTECSVDLNVGSPVDYESHASLQLLVRVTDTDGMQATLPVSVVLTDINESPVSVSFMTGEIRTEENAGGLSLGTFIVGDPDDGDTATFLLTRDDGAKFTLTPSGLLATAPGPGLNYEEEQVHLITVKVTDSAGNTLKQDFNVTVVNVNERPSGLSLDPDSSVMEMSAADTVIGQLVVEDPDNQGLEGRVQDFTFLLLSDIEGRFQIDGDVLKVKDIGEHCTLIGGSACLLDHETKSTHQVIVTVTDTGTPPVSASFVLHVHVKDANDRPTQPVLDTRFVSESTEVGSVIGELSSADQDRGQTVNYDVVGESASLFSVNGTRLALAHVLDHERQKEVAVTIRVTDDGQPPLSSEETFTISVEDVNEAPTEMTMVPKQGGVGVDFEVDKPVIMEDTEMGFVVAQLVVLDPDLQEGMTVLLATNSVIDVGSMSCLSLTKGSRCVGDVTLGRELNYEEKMTWTVDVTAVDGGGLKIEKTFIIEVGDNNDPPQDLVIDGKAVNTISVPENSQAITLATLGAVDPDRNQEHSFSVRGSNLFFIAGDQLKVMSAAVLNYEETNEYKIQVKITDTGVPPLSLEKEVLVHVTDVNEAPTDVKLSINKVREDSEPGAVIGQLVTTDPDNTVSVRQSHSYRLTDDAEGRFAVQGDSLIVKDAKFDFETSQSHSIVVEVTDSGESPLKAVFTLTVDVLDANDAPTDLRLDAHSIPEDTAVGTVVGTVSAEDVDEGQSLRYTMGTSSNFVITGHDVLVDGTLDFETSSLVILQLQVTDTGQPPKSMNKTFEVEITDVNEVPGVVELVSTLPDGTLQIPESTKAGDVIARLTTFDPDKVDFVAMRMTSRSDPRLRLAAEGSSCEEASQEGRPGTQCTVHVQLATALNYEDSKDDLRLEVRTMDKGGLGRTEGWTFSVADSNDKPTAIYIRGGSPEIPENQEGYVVGELQCSDPDPGDSHVFQLVTQWDLFQVGLGGVLAITRPLNYEQRRDLDVMVRCMDSGTPPLSVTQTLTFMVKNVNEKPSEIILSHTEISMTAPKNSIVGFLMVTDPDNEGLVDMKQQHVCHLTEGQSVFYIDGAKSTLRVKDKIPADRNAVPITINCTDDGQPPLSVTKQVQVLVVETADVPKEVRLNGTGSVPENSPGTVLGELIVVNLLTDAPVLGTYNCAGLKVLETEEVVLAIEGKNLVTKQPLDFESLPRLTATLTCTGHDMKDQEFTVDGEITVDIVDVNEAPTEIRTYGGAKVAENSPAGTVITELNTVDPEPEQNYTYTLRAVAAGLNTDNADENLLSVFALEGRSLTVGPKAALLNHEATPVFSLLVQSVDNGQPPLSVEDTVLVEVLDSNDPPTAIDLDKNQVSENSAVDTVVGHLSVTDEDEGQSHSCLVTNLQDVPFTIKNDLDLVVASEDLDYESARTHVVEVTCQDDGNDGSHLRVSASLTVTVSDVNEAPYDVSLSQDSVAENSPAGQVVGEVMATDPDSLKVTFLVEKGTEHFQIVGDNTLTALSSFNYEEVASLPVSIRATDNQGMSTVKDFLIQIGDENDPPSSLGISSHVVSESTPPGGEVARLVTEDPDRGQTFTFHLDPDPTVLGHFAVSEDRLVVGEEGVDYETSSSFRVRITAVDSGTPPRNITVKFDIEITDENEAPTDIITEPLLPLHENATIPYVLTKISVIDQEGEEPHSCRLIGSHGPLSVETHDDGALTLVVIGQLDFETAPRYDVILNCSDGMYDVSKNVSLEVRDVNEPPTQMTLSGPGVVPATVRGEQGLGELTVTDQDRGQSHTLVIRGPNSDLLAIRSGNQLVLTRPVPTEVLSMPSPEVTFTVTATDNGQPPLSMRQTFTLPVTHVDLRELRLPEIVLNNSRVLEDDVQGTVVGAIYDLNDTLSGAVLFSLVKDEERLFRIENNQVLVLSRNMSMFTGHSAEVTIQALNSRTGETAQRTITVLVKRSDKCYKDGRTCDENARCVALSEVESQCQCDDDFSGDGYTCEQVNDCVTEEGGSPCVHGDCADGVEEFQCECPPGYNGPLCEIEEDKADPCTHDPCGEGSAACLPDPANLTAFTCTCLDGWQGHRCDRSQDDCLTGRCHGANSTCLDRHLTYLCLCEPQREGPRCEYLKEACAGEPCEEGQVCVPKPGSVEHTCVTHDFTMSFLFPCRQSGITDMEICQARFLDFVSFYGRFKTAGVQVYLARWAEKAGGDQVNVTMVAVDAEGLVYSRADVLDALHHTCQSIKTDGLKETTFCPAIETEYGKLQGEGNGEGEGNAEGNEGLPIGIVAGGGGGALVLIIVIIIVVIVLKRRKNKADSDQQDIQNHALTPSSIEDHDSALGEEESSRTETSQPL
ncbi:protocadherin-16-like [Babylonia areolata]|uniref:protocadherin-16-like n=1 Tax=Babylonia areolata TaxID=304850 RepID=UPI003FD69C80